MIGIRRYLFLALTVFTGLFVVACQSSGSYSGSANTEMENYLRAMPKAELHIHLEGTLSPETIAEISTRNQLDYFTTAQEVRDSLANRPPGLMGFLEHHFKSQNVMQNQGDFYHATFNLIEKLAANNIVYVDLFFDPQAHTSRGIPFSEMFAGIDTARNDAQEQFGVTVNLIICINRERSVASAFAMLDQASSVRHKIIGLGMDSGPEYGNPPLKFQEVYARARKEGYMLTGHHDVDVRDSLKHIRQSLDVLKLDRLDHGINAAEDPALVAQLVARNMCLTGSPIKRVSDPQPQDIDLIKTLDAAGVCISLHTDDPEEFQSGYLNNLLILFQAAAGYSKADMTRLMHNAFKALWLPEDQKNAYIQNLKDYAQSNGVDWKNVEREP